MTKRKTTRDHRYDIGVLIGIAREDHNHSQTQAAAACGVSQTKWNHWEKHHRLPDRKEMGSIITHYLRNYPGIWERYDMAVADWDSMGRPVATRSYNTPGGKKGDPHQR